MENARLQKIMSLIENMAQDGGTTSSFLSDLFHGWLCSEFCGDATPNERGNYYSYMLELCELLDYINERPHVNSQVGLASSTSVSSDV